MFSGFDLAAQHRAIFNGQSVGLNLADYLPRTPELHFVAPRNFSFHASANNHFAGGHIRFHAAVWPDGQAPVGKTQLSVHLAVDEKIFAPRNLASYFDSLADAGRGFRRDRYFLRCLTDWGRNGNWGTFEMGSVWICMDRCAAAGSCFLLWGEPGLPCGGGVGFFLFCLRA